MTTCPLRATTPRSRPAPTGAARAPARGARPDRDLRGRGRPRRRRGRRGVLHRRGRPARRPGGGVRQRQVGDLPGDHGAAAPSAAARVTRRGALRRARPAHRRDATCAGCAGREIAMVFQDPMSSLNPVVRSASSCAEVLTPHLRRRQGRGPQDARSTCSRRSASPTRPTAQGVPAPALRRHAPARADRDRAGLRAPSC